MNQTVQPPAHVEYAAKAIVDMILTNRLHINSCQGFLDCTDIDPELRTITSMAHRSAVETEKKLLKRCGKLQLQYIKCQLDKDKMYDIAMIIALMNRIGTEEKQEVYEEFMGLLVVMFDKVYYSQEKRKHLNFNKYKALIKIITDEIVHDTNHTEGIVMYNKSSGHLYFRSVKANNRVKIQ